jgi:hypothetical protein
MRPAVITIDHPWMVGDIVVSNTTDFGITEGNEYKILRRDEAFYDCFYIKDDTGNEVSYTDEYFELKDQSKLKVKRIIDDLNSK